MGHADRPDDGDQRSYCAACPEVSVELGEQGIGDLAAPKEGQRWRQHLGEKEGIGGRATGRAHLEVTVEELRTSRLGSRNEQRAVDHIDAPGSVGVDDIAQSHCLVDGVGDVAQGAGAEVGGQGVEQDVDCDRRRHRGDLSCRCP